jgi:hypothetical protein
MKTSSQSKTTQIMEKSILPPELAGQLAELYAEMEKRYNSVAAELGFSCVGCPDNCCDSYFQHHTYIEWAYLWTGLHSLPAAELDEIMVRSTAYIKQSEAMLRSGALPTVMCPLNREGLCSLYAHRLMICRLHGVPATLSRPDGRVLEFPGCFRCQELVALKKEDCQALPSLERIDLFNRLAELEMRLLDRRRGAVPKVKMTIAQMVLSGPPRLG